MNLGSRLAFALIGLVCGAVFGLLLWLVLDIGLQFKWSARGVQMGIQQWVTYSAGFFAVVGFVFQDKVGSALGFGVSQVYEFEADTWGGPDVPNWLVVVFVAGVSLAVWYYWR
jgi:hypothetical protein